VKIIVLSSHKPGILNNSIRIVIADMLWMLNV
jgi:hypothetical protein